MFGDCTRRVKSKKEVRSMALIIEAYLPGATYNALGEAEANLPGVPPDER